MGGEKEWAKVGRTPGGDWTLTYLVVVLGHTPHLGWGGHARLHLWPLWCFGVRYQVVEALPRAWVGAHGIFMIIYEVGESSHINIQCNCISISVEKAIELHWEFLLTNVSLCFVLCN